MTLGAWLYRCRLLLKIYVMVKALTCCCGVFRYWTYGPAWRLVACCVNVCHLLICWMDGLQYPISLCVCPKFSQTESTRTQQTPRYLVCMVPTYTTYVKYVHSVISTLVGYLHTRSRYRPPPAILSMTHTFARAPEHTSFIQIIHISSYNLAA